MNYGYVIKRAWEIIWKNKLLFVFGILSSCGLTSLQTQTNYSTDTTAYKYLENIESGQLLNYISENLFNFILIVLGILFLSLLLSLVFFAIRSFGQIGLIQGVFHVEEAENEEQPLTFRDRYEKIKPFLWRFMGLNFLVYFVLLFLPMILFFSVFFFLGVENFEIIFLLFLCSFLCVFMILSWVVAYSLILANRSLIYEDLSIKNALKTGLTLLKKNIGVFILISLVSFVLSIMLIIIVYIPLSMITMFSLSSVEQFTQEMRSPSQILIPTSIVMLVIQWFFQTYFQTFWTLLYLEIKKKDTIVEELETENI